MRILWIPHASWATPQRARVFCRALSSRHEVHVTDWIADFRAPSDFLSRRYVRNFTYRRSNDNGITVHGIPRIAPAYFSSALRRINANVYSACIRRIVQQCRIEAVVGSYAAEPPDVPRLVLDMADDSAGYASLYGPRVAFAHEIVATEREYLRRAHTVVAVSSVLVERIQAEGYRGPLSLIPNGVRLAEYTPERGAAIRRALGLNGPVVGVIGNHDKQNEMLTVLEVAQRLLGTPATVLVVGRGAALKWAQRTARAMRLSNVRFVGLVPPETVSAYFAAVDVGLCPYAVNPASDASSPMRLIAYSAAGCQVICTDLLEVRRMQFENVSLVQNTPEALTAGVRQALRAGRRRPHRIGTYDLDRLVGQYESILRGESDARITSTPTEDEVS